MNYPGIGPGFHASNVVTLNKAVQMFKNQTELIFLGDSIMRSLVASDMILPGYNGKNPLGFSMSVFVSVEDLGFMI